MRLEDAPDRCGAIHNPYAPIASSGQFVAPADVTLTGASTFVFGEHIILLPDVRRGA